MTDALRFGDPIREHDPNLGIYKFRFAPLYTTVWLDHLDDTRDGVRAEVVVRSNPGTGWKKLYHDRLTLISSRSRASAASHCAKTMPDLDWQQIFDTVCLETLDAHRGGEPSIMFRDLKQREGLEYRLTPLLADGRPTLLYAPGGTGKSYLAVFASVLVAMGYMRFDLGMEPEPGPVLYLDWETEEQDFRDMGTEVMRGLGLDDMDPPIVYRRMTGSLRHNLESVQAAVSEHGVQMLVVDSAAPACGGNPESMEAVGAFFDALRGIRMPADTRTSSPRPITSLILAHKAKNSESTGPFGSVFWWNYPRAVYRMHSSPHDGETTMVVALKHEKANRGQRQHPMGLRFTWADGGFSVEAASVTDDYDLAEKAASTSQRIVAAIKENGWTAMTAPEIADELDIAHGTVRQALNRGSGKIFAKLAGDRWGLIAGV